ncbi:cation:proton antiporter [Oscillatoria sp. CS-180]|uniref:cation:proton antiporter n=1 Tax=Oscillatoria sp. CS-180 TaxID=3021720 RepID=UPI00232ECCEF|nr:cation:proton antiporter [Oscillatoria sp. CS-180]MDB9528093.1 cation:proton antiporter [Oscillatoria sp. CS-180]
MAAGHQFVLDLTIALGASAVSGFIAHRLRQPALLGYLAAGLLIGPSGFGLLNDVEQIEELAEIGVAFLLFALGVEFSLAELKRVQKIAIQGSLLQMGATILLVLGISSLTGWATSPLQGVFLGFVLALSSTAVVLKILTERGETGALHGQLMLALLIAQDLALGLMLAFLPALNQPDAFLLMLTGAIFKFFIFLAGAIVVGRWFVPKLMRTVAATESQELFLLTTIALCLGIAWTTAMLGLSIEMGAFVAGLMVAEVDYSEQALGRVLPLRDTFACLFFASVGMLIDPQVLVNNWIVILELVSLVMIGKALVILPIILRFGYSFKTALLVSVGLNQIGEFSFVLSLQGFGLGIITEQQYLLLLGTTAITLVLTPAWINSAPFLTRQFKRVPYLKRWLDQLSEPQLLSVPDNISDHIIVAGYGRVGQVIVNILLNRGYTVLVIENSEAAIQKLRRRHIPFIYGDADAEQVLEKTHVSTAKALAIALPDPISTRLLLQQALARAPQLDIIARSHTYGEIDLLTQLGAREVVQPEFEAAMELGAHLLRTLGEETKEIQTVLEDIRRDRYQSVRG